MPKATLHQLKDHNTQLVLRTIFQRARDTRSANEPPVISRAELARQTGLTKPTISEIVVGLIEDGLVAEVGVGASAGGKPPMLLQPLVNSRQIACLELDSFELRGALVNLCGEMQQRINIPIKDRKGDQALNRVYVLIDNLLAAASAPILGIGVGSPGLVNTQTGLIIQAVNLGWYNLPLGDLLGERYNCPIYILNDSQAAALAEFTYPTQNGSANMVLIKSGQGIGAGLIIHNEIFPGDGFAAGEIGHVRVVENGLPCSCGKFGCLETVSSNRALINQAVKLGRLDSQQAERPEAEVMLHLIEAYRRGDQIIRRMVYETGIYLGTVIANLVSVLDINKIVISGAITAFGSILLEGIHQQIEDQVLQSVARQIKVSFSSLENDAVMLGMSALTAARELGINARS